MSERLTEERRKELAEYVNGSFLFTADSNICVLLREVDALRAGCDEARQALRDVQAAAGHPDAAEGCRNVIRIARETSVQPSRGKDYHDDEPCVWPECLTDPDICCGDRTTCRTDALFSEALELGRVRAEEGDYLTSEELAEVLLNAVDAPHYKPGNREGRFVLNLLRAVATLSDRMHEADQEASLLHDLVYSETFDQQAASDVIWRVHRLLRVAALPVPARPRPDAR